MMRVLSLLTACLYMTSAERSLTGYHARPIGL